MLGETSMLTRNEALEFIENILEIPKPEVKLEKNKLDFLNDIIPRLHTIPFQSLTLMAEDLSKRRRPTLQEIKCDMLETRGGICYSLNTFLFCILTALGYDAHMNHCTVSSSVTYPDNHVVVIVKNVLRAEDLYLVEISVGYPTFRAVSLDFQKESPLFKDSFLEYKYVKVNGKVMRMHGKGDFRANKPLPCDFFLGDFRRFYEFEMNLTKEFNKFNDCFDVVYTKPYATPFHSSLRAVVFKDKRAVIMVNSRLMLETDDAGFDVTNYDDDESLAQAYKEYFPQFDNTVITRAIACWRTPQVDQPL